MYAFVTGPLAWISFIIFFVGIVAHCVIYIRGLDWQLDRVAYKPYMSIGLKGALRSIFFWIFPFGTHSWRQNPFFTLVIFAFHVGLLVTPIFLSAHNLMLKESIGIQLATLPDGIADILTGVVIIAGVFLILRRIALQHVRIITTSYDYLLLAISLAPFITGFLAYHQVGAYHFWLILHVLSGELFLIAIPFTKLSHFVLFFMSRAQIGMDFGIKRGGMTGSPMQW